VDWTDWIINNPIEGLAYLLVAYVLGTTLMLPASIFTLTLGYISCKLFGELGGFFFALVLVYIAATLGSTLAFLVGRMLLKKGLDQWVRPSWKKTKALLSALETKGFKIVFLCRLSPVLPYNLLNYLLGASSVSMKHYVYASVGMIPMGALYIYIAMSVQSLDQALSESKAKEPWYWVVMAFGGVLLAFTVIYITCLGKKELNTMLEEQLKEDSEEPN